jgi:hypothetical protein
MSRTLVKRWAYLLNCVYWPIKYVDQKCWLCFTLFNRNIIVEGAQLKNGTGRGIGTGSMKDIIGICFIWIAFYLDGLPVSYLFLKLFNVFSMHIACVKMRIRCELRGLILIWPQVCSTLLILCMFRAKDVLFLLFNGPKAIYVLLILCLYIKVGSYLTHINFENIN